MALLVLAAVAVTVTAALWVYAVARLGGDPSAALASRSGSGATPEGTATTLVAVVDDAQEPAVLVSPALLLQTGGPREGAPVGVLLPVDLQVTADGMGAVPLEEVLAEGGLDPLIRAASDYTGLAVAHYVLVERDALADLVEILDRVERCEGPPEGSRDCQPILAADVPAVDRDADADTFLRAAEVVQAVAERARSPWVLVRPWRAKAAIDLVADRVRTNIGLRGQALYSAADTLRVDRNLDLRVVPTVTDPQQGVRLAFAERAEQIFQPLRDGTALPGDAGRTDGQEILRAEIRILVWNGAGTAGLAARIEARLVAEGFAVVATDNAPSFGRETTEIAYSPDALPLALLVAEYFDGAELRELDRPLSVDGQPVDIRITAGLDQVDD